MKKSTLSITALTLAGIFTLTAAAAGIKTISADLRPDITVVVNGKKQDTMTDVTGKQVYPISYEGTVYLPIRALGDALNHDAAWDGNTQTITLTNRTRLPGFSSVEGAEQGIAALEKEIANLKSASTYPERAKQYAEYSAKLENFRSDLDLVYAQVEDDYQLGRSTYATYRALIERLDKVGVRVKDAQSALEKKTIADTSGYQTAYESASARIKALDGSLKSVETKISNLVSGATYTERVKQYKALDKELSPLYDELRDLFSDMNDDLRENRLTYSQYADLTSLADALDSRVKSARTALEKKTISIEDPETPSKPSGSGDYDAYVKQIADVDKRADTVVKNVYQYKEAQGENNNKQAFRQLENKLDALDEELDRLDDALERDYHDGKLTASDYRALEQSLEKIEDKLEDAADYLEDVLGYDD